MQNQNKCLLTVLQYRFNIMMESIFSKLILGDPLKTLSKISFASNEKDFTRVKDGGENPFKDFFGF